MFKFILYLFLTIASLISLILSNSLDYTIISTLSGLLFGHLEQKTKSSFQDLTDTTNWKKSQRKLERGGFIDKDTYIRISFAYLFRIKIDGKYLLVRNERNTKKFQPVGGVYKMDDSEKNYLSENFNVLDDNKISIDESSRNDYRLRIKNKYLRKFIKRFDSTPNRETLENLSREFKEELVDKQIINWKNIKYKVCGRHVTEIIYSKHFQIYELLLADVVEIMLTPKQETDLRKMITNTSDYYCFANENEIASLGVDAKCGLLEETIADHSEKILKINQESLIEIPNTKKEYEVKL